MTALPPDVRALLERATAGSPPSQAVRVRLAARIQHSVTGGGGAVAGGVAAKAAIGATALAIVAIVAAPRETPPPQAPTVAYEPSEPVIAAGETNAIVLEPAVAPTVEPPTPRAAIAQAPLSPIAEPPAATPPPAAAAPDPRERLLVEKARRAVAAREAPRAIELLDTHQAEFPDGKLREEREALMVQALSLVGNHLAAAARARAFRATYPTSIFLDLVNDSTREPP
jgi:hypothetical protein